MTSKIDIAGQKGAFKWTAVAALDAGMLGESQRNADCNKPESHPSPVLHVSLWENCEIFQNAKSPAKSAGGVRPARKAKLLSSQSPFDTTRKQATVSLDVPARIRPYVLSGQPQLYSDHDEPLVIQTLPKR